MRFYDPDCSDKQKSACSIVLSRAIHSPFLGISRCQVSDVLLSISGGSSGTNLCVPWCCTKPILHVLEGWGETKIGETPQLKKSLKNTYKIVSCLAHRKL